jgi:hypothetical protein
MLLTFQDANCPLEFAIYAENLALARIVKLKKKKEKEKESKEKERRAMLR